LGAGVHLARLRAHDRRLVPDPELRGEQASVVVGGDDVGWCAEPQHAERPIDRPVALLADDDANPWRAVESLPLDVPVRVREHVVARGGERGEARHLAAGHEAVRDALG
jgi:hypothetical protein